MQGDESTVFVSVKADTRSAEDALKALEDRSKQFGSAITNALAGAVTNGKSFEDSLRRLAMTVANISLKAGMQPLQNMMSGLFESFFQGLQGKTKAHALGGIVNSPTYFNDGGSLGLMGEAGAEAIMPLARGADGKLGVASHGGGAPIQVTFNVTTPDAGSFRKSEAQITGMLAQAVRRGARTL